MGLTRRSWKPFSFHLHDPSLPQPSGVEIICLCLCVVLTRSYKKLVVHCNISWWHHRPYPRRRVRSKRKQFRLRGTFSSQECMSMYEYVWVIYILILIYIYIISYIHKYICMYRYDDGLFDASTCNYRWSTLWSCVFIVLCLGVCVCLWYNPWLQLPGNIVGLWLQKVEAMGQLGSVDTAVRLNCDVTWCHRVRASMLHEIEFCS